MLGLPRLSATAATFSKKYLENLMETKLCAYSGIDPLGLLLGLGAAIKGFAHIKVRAALIHPGKAKSTLINWQSATDFGKDHKVKELCGRVVALRHTWGNEKEQFLLRPGVAKLRLLADGTWTREELDTFFVGGWDEIFYPDEFDQLAMAII
jgi:hypothetical protein